SWLRAREPALQRSRAGILVRVLLRMRLRTLVRIFGLFRNRRGLLLPPSLQAAAERWIAQRQNTCGQERRVDGAGVADRERAHRDAGRHLHDGIKRVLP